MHEINPEIVKQRGGEGFRLRWYSDESHDLYVWLSDEGRLMRFQFCYDKGSLREQVVRWKLGGAVEHALIDDGERLHRKQTPIFVSNGAWDPREPLDHLRADRSNIDLPIYMQLIKILRETDLRAMPR